MPCSNILLLYAFLQQTSEELTPSHKVDSELQKIRLFVESTKEKNIPGWTQVEYNYGGALPGRTVVAYLFVEESTMI